MKSNPVKLLIGLVIVLIVVVVVGIGVLSRKASAPDPVQESSQAAAQNPGKSSQPSQPRNPGTNTTPNGDYEVENIFRPNLGTTYIGWQENPTVRVATKPFTCTEVNSSEVGRTLRRTIEGHVYCVTTSFEGGAGSKYSEYTYSTEMQGKLVTLHFTIRSINCGVYGGEPQYTACAAERYDPDALALSIFQSLSL